MADAASPPRARLEALRRVAAVVDAAPAAVLAECAATVLAKPLLRRFEDASEPVRELAVGTFAALVDRAEDRVLEMLPYAVPVLRERQGPIEDAFFVLGEAEAERANARVDPRSGAPRSLASTLSPPTEPCEEIRVRTMALLTRLVRASALGFAPYASDAAAIFTRATEDAHHEVVVEACACLRALVSILDRRLTPVSKKLAWTFAPNLTHRRAKVRVATLEAMRPLIHCGAHETILDLVAFKHPNLVPIKAFYGEDRKVNYFGKLATDDNAQTRLAFVETLRDWMTTLVERTDHESRLLPYVLSAMSDENDRVATEAARLLEDLGAQYEREHEKELKTTMAYMPEYYGGGPGGGAGGGEEGTAADSEDAFVLPRPFAARPRLGARILAKNNFAATVNPTIAEMGGWQEEHRARAATLLRTNIVLLEENATQHTQALCLAFVNAMRESLRSSSSSSSSDSRATCDERVAECCRLLGRFVRPDEWLATLLDTLGPENDAGTVAGALAVLAACLSGASHAAMTATSATTTREGGEEEEAQPAPLAASLPATTPRDAVLAAIERRGSRRPRIPR